MLIRPTRPADLPEIQRLAAMTGAGFTSLNPDENLLTQRIEHSMHSFEHGAANPRQAHYLFAMEDPESGALAGVCGIKAAVGLDAPFYSYRVGTEVTSYRKLGIYQQQQTLYLCNDYSGSAEIGSLFLDPSYRGRSNGRLLSQCRFLFLAEFAELFPERVIAEMRGSLDDKGRSPFWESLARHFLPMDFSEADALSGSGDQSFIAELMPRHPIYVSLLPAAAQACIGQVHRHTVAARRILEAEGFRFQNYVDIFDAGPTLEVRLADIRTGRDSRCVEVAPSDDTGDVQWYLVSNTSRQAFRCTRGPLALDDAGRAILSPVMRSALDVTSGDTVRIAPLQR